MRLDETATVAGRVGAGVDSEHHEPTRAIVPPEMFEHRRLALARAAPGGEEVEHDGLAAERGEREVAFAREPAEREGGRGRPDLRRRRLVGELPHEQRREKPDACDGKRLRPELEPAPQVPPRTAR